MMDSLGSGALEMKVQDVRGAGASGAIAQRADEHWPHYAEDEVEAVAAVLRSGRVNQWTGDTVARFEAAFSRKMGLTEGMALANGSVALELALLAFGIGLGDEVVVTPRSFLASATCVKLVGATPIFADVERDSGNISAATIAPVLTNRTRAIIPVHLAGWPCDMPAIMALAGERGIKVIEDCAQSHGAAVDGLPAGSFGDAAAFSFCQDKIMSTGGEGGFTSFKDDAAREWAWSFKDHGKNRAKMMAPPEHVGFRWVHDSVGTNWRLTGIQAAIGLSQLDKLDKWLEARAQNAAIWSRVLSQVPGLRVPAPPPHMRHAFYKLYFYVDAPDARAKRDAILKQAAAAGLRVFAGSCPEVYLEKALSDEPRPDLPVARELGDTSLLVEVHPTLDPQALEARAALLARIAAEILT